MMNMKSFQFAIPASSSAMMSLKHWQFTLRQLLFSISCHEDLYSSISPLIIFVIVLKYPRVAQELLDKPFGCLLLRKGFKKFRENCVVWTSWSVQNHSAILFRIFRDHSQTPVGVPKHFSHLVSGPLHSLFPPRCLVPLTIFADSAQTGYCPTFPC